ncbi:cytochrome aa3 quinol oxidase subunit II [Salibacterium salarium]|uniref:Quinol oxidase subunit 2 n=1 Tax=Salibacterium salarium TaxID=284579 RepID=A0A3R9Q6U0_9BACI|nr:cytochrome aa3 quinol oxidase subunit II [Salibacterium salarium]RSL34903.1 cytochrome aa3 quinol oxidase subunit II [Salibacterium salarium]
MKDIYRRIKRWAVLPAFALIFLVTGCADLTVLDPKGPVGESQSDLIIFSIILMLFVVAVVFVAFTYMIIKYRERPDRGEKDYDPDHEGNTKLEIIWTVIPLIIVTALSIPTVITIYELEEPPESSSEKEPLVVYATSADWKWFFSYPEQDIETVNYLHIPTDRAIEFRLSSADSMASLWIPALGGQKYNMAGMENTLYLQADEEGTYEGRNSNYTGSGFAEQTFDVHAEPADEFETWVEETQEDASELTQEKYDSLLAPGLLKEMEFSSTHLDYVDHGTHQGSDYLIKRHKDAFEEPLHLEGGRGVEDE